MLNALEVQYLHADFVLLLYNKLMRSKTSYTAIIEQDATTGYYVAYIPDLPGAHTQAETLEELKDNIKEVVELVLEENPKSKPESYFIGTQLVTI